MATPTVTSASAPQTVIPRFDTEFVDENRRIRQPWHRLLVDLYKKLGSSQANTPASVYFQLLANGQIQIFSSGTNASLGFLVFTGQIGKIPVPQPVGISPFTFSPTVAGTLMVENGMVEISRSGGGGIYYKVSQVGGAIPMLSNDTVRVTWFGATAPKVTFFPTF